MSKETGYTRYRTFHVLEILNKCNIIFDQNDMVSAFYLQANVVGSLTKHKTHLCPGCTPKSFKALLVHIIFIFSEAHSEVE
jgi:hypothetical protein